jgi:hypothetical protein
MDIIKKESYHSLHMWNEWNGAVSVHGNKTVKQNREHASFGSL